MFEILKKNSSLEAKLAELEARVAALEKQNRELKKSIRTMKKQAESSEKLSKGDASFLKQAKEAAPEIAKKTGWTTDEVIKRMMDARKRTHCSVKEYKLYQFYTMNEEQQNSLFLKHLSQALTDKYSHDRSFISVLCDKEKTNDLLAECVGRPWCVNTKISAKDFASTFANSTRVIYKPLAGNCGKGVEAFNISPEDIQQVYDVLKDYPAGVVEEYVVQHPKMSSLCPTSVNTVRVVTFSSNSAPVCGDKMMDIAYTALRVGGAGAIVDNFHSGGMCAVIDKETGTVCTDAADMEGNFYEAHPGTGTTFRGFEIPFFDEIIAMVTKAISDHKIEGYLGWDIAITEKGPTLIELNNTPAVALLTMPYVREKKGMKHIMEKYL